MLRITRSNSSVIKLYSENLMSLLQEFGEWNKVHQVYTKNRWYLYRIAQEAGSCGWHLIMQHITKDLSRTVETEASKYWLSSLFHFACSEATLAESTLDQAHEITTAYLDSLIQFRGFRALVGAKVFGIWFIQLRMEFVCAIEQMHKRLSHGANRTVSERKKRKMLIDSAHRFRELASRYDFLHRSYYGLDQATLSSLDSLKTCALIFDYAIQVLLGTSVHIDPTLIPVLDTEKPLTQDTNAAAPLFGICQTFLRTIVDWDGVTDNRADLESHVTANISTFSKSILSCPLSLPSFFFNGRAKVNVQLITDPRLNDQTAQTVQRNEDLVMKFEGFVKSEDGIDITDRFSKAFIVCSLTRENPRHFHDLLGVDMILSDPPEMIHQKPNGMTFLQPPITFSADIMNNYFTCKGLLHLPTVDGPEGAHGAPSVQQEGWLNVFVNIVDQNSNIWSMGPYHCGKVTWP
ncbi:hypothetical protein BX666DRAFT_1502053 [Dichotomocladium elegans]|nr:hypothetical protein BX666DRAFT_1502053 [Dichotomocladium elegans]